MNSIIRYVFAREIYNKYSENRGEIAHLLSLENIWSFLISIIAIIIAISYSFSFSKKNDLKLNHLKLNDSIYLIKSNSYTFNEIPIYQIAVEKNKYYTDSLKGDTIISYNFTQKIDSKFNFKKAIGVFNGKHIAKSNDEDYTDNKKLIGFMKSSNLTLSKPDMSDFSYDEKNKYSKDLYIEIENVKKIDTPEPERRWFQHFVYSLIAIFSLKKILTSLLRLLKRKVPVYERFPVYKRDNRYSTGMRIVRWKSEIKEYRDFTAEELQIHKKQQTSKILFNGIILLISVGLLFYIYIF